MAYSVKTYSVTTLGDDFIGEFKTDEEISYHDIIIMPEGTFLVEDLENKVIKVTRVYKTIKSL